MRDSLKSEDYWGKAQEFQDMSLDYFETSLSEKRLAANDPDAGTSAWASFQSRLNTNLIMYSRGDPIEDIARWSKELLCEKAAGYALSYPVDAPRDVPGQL